MVHIVDYEEVENEGFYCKQKVLWATQLFLSSNSRKFLGPPPKLFKLRCKSADFYIFEPLSFFFFFSRLILCLNFCTNT